MSIVRISVLAAVALAVLTLAYPRVAFASDPTASVQGGSAVTEGGTSPTWTITFTASRSEDTTVNYTVTQDGAFVAITNLGSKTVTMPANSTTVSVAVAVVDDAVDEGDGGITVTLNTGTGYTVSGTDGDDKVTVNDDDASPTYGSWTLYTDTTDVSAAVDFNTITGSATNCEFSNCASGIYTSTGSNNRPNAPHDGAYAMWKTGSGNSAVTHQIATYGQGNRATRTKTGQGNYGIWDTTPDNEYITATAALLGSHLRPYIIQITNAGSVPDDSSYNGPITLPTQYAVLVTEPDSNRQRLYHSAWGSRYWERSRLLPYVASVTGGAAVTEGTALMYTISLSSTSDEAVTMNYTVTQSGSFVASGDTGAKTINIPAHTSSVMFVISTVDDNVDESNGSVTVTLNIGDGYSVSNTVSEQSATRTVNDNDATASISAGSAVTEGTDASFTLTFNESRSVATTVNYTVTQSGSFVASADLGAKTVSVSSGTTSVTVTVPTVADSLDEANGSVTVTLNSGTGYTVHATNDDATVTVNDDDEPAASVSGGSAVTEGTAASYTISVSIAPVSDLTVNYSVTQSGGLYVASGNLGSKTTTISAGSTSVSITVATVSDSVDEDNGSVTVTLTTGSGYSLGANSSASVTVNDDDTAPTLSVSGGSAVTEGSAASFTLTLSAARDSSTTANYTVTQSGSFGVSTGSATATISAGNTTATLSLTTTGDSRDESNGSVTVTLNSGTGYTVHGTNDTASVTINDDDATPTLSVTGGSAVTEGTAASFTLTLTAARDETTTLNYGVTQSGAFVDSANLGSKTVSLSAGDSSVTVTVATVGDSVDELNGSVTVTLETGTGYTGTGSATVTVNDDEPPTASITGGAAVIEGTAASFTITFISPSAAAVTVNYTVTQSGSFVASGNLGSKTASMPADTSSLSITVATVADSGHESHGSVTVTLNSGTDYNVHGTNNAATVTVNDDDDAPQAAVVAGASTGVIEGSSASFLILLTEASGQATTVNYTVTQSGSFVTDANLGAKTASISAGATSVTVTVATEGDSVDEAGGSVTVTLNSGTGYEVVSSYAAASASVVDDDDSYSIVLTVGNSGDDYGYVSGDYGTLTSGSFPGDLFFDGESRTIASIYEDDDGYWYMTYTGGAPDGWHPDLDAITMTVDYADSVDGRSFVVGGFVDSRVSASNTLKLRPPLPAIREWDERGTEAVTVSFTRRIVAQAGAAEPLTSPEGDPGSFVEFLSATTPGGPVMAQTLVVILVFVGFLFGAPATPWGIVLSTIVLVLTPWVPVLFGYGSTMAASIVLMNVAFGAYSFKAWFSRTES